MAEYPLKNFVFACEYDPFLYTEEEWSGHIGLLVDSGVNQVHFGRGIWRLTDEAGEASILQKCLAFSDCVADKGLSVVINAGTDRLPPSQKLHWQQSASGIDAGYAEARFDWITSLVKTLQSHPARVAWSLSLAEVEALLSTVQIEEQAHFQLWLQNRFGTIAAYNRELFPDSWADWQTDWQLINVPDSAAPMPLRCAYHAYQIENRQTAFSKLSGDWLQLDPQANFFYPAGFSMTAAAASVFPVIELLLEGDARSDVVNLDAVLPMTLPESVRPAPFMLQLAANGEAQQLLMQNNQERLSTLIWRTFLAGAQGILWPQWMSLYDSHKHALPLLPARRADAFAKEHPIHACRSWIDAQGLFEAVDDAQCALISPPSSPCHAICAAGDDRSLLLADYYQAFRAVGVTRAVIHPDVDFSPYKVLFAPVLPVIDRVLIERLFAFVENGGCLVTGFKCGQYNSQGGLLDGSTWQLWEQLLGIAINAAIPFAELEGLAVRMRDGRIVKAGYHCDWLELKGATALGSYANGPFINSPALTVHSVGRGQVFYIGMRPKASFFRYALADLADKMDLRRPAFEFGDGVEVAERQYDGNAFYALINNGDEPVVVDWKAIRGTDVLTGRACRGRMTVAAKEKLLVKQL
jgi:hypothetical protein